MISTIPNQMSKIPENTINSMLRQTKIVSKSSFSKSISNAIILINLCFDTLVLPISKPHSIGLGDTVEFTLINQSKIRYTSAIRYTIKINDNNCGINCIL
mgnify:CR=1 FL=1